jgi:peptidoglycan hydrolase CwlO-like protein
MRVLTVQVAIIFLVTVSACTVENADVSALISQSLKTYNQFEKIKGRMKAATSDVAERLIPIQAQIHWFKQPVPDDEGIHDINNNIRVYKYQISTFEANIEAARITDSRERARLVDKYEADMKRLLAEELDAGKPFKKRIDKLKKGI